MTTDVNPDTGSAPASGGFDKTRWSVVLGAQKGSETALDTLFKNYRAPLLVWLRARHYSLHDAEDLVQGFFAGLLRRDFLREVGQQKGKFRTFLLTSLQNHANDVREKEHARKRGGLEPKLSLEETDDQGRLLREPASSGTAPDLEYDRAWAQAVLANSLRTLESECARTGHVALCEALEPVMFADETASPYREIGERLGMSEGAVKTAAKRIRDRFRGILREEIMQTVRDEKEFEEELSYLFGLFGK